MKPPGCEPSGKESRHCPFSFVRFLIPLLLGTAVSSFGETVTAAFSSVSDIPVTTSSFIATDKDLDLTLGFAPATGAELMIVKNTGLLFISGQFKNLAHGQEVDLSYNGDIYKFVANYYGGTGNDLVLLWQRRWIYSWGSNSDGLLGDTTNVMRRLPVEIVHYGGLSGKTVLSVSMGNRHSLALCSDGSLAAWGGGNNGQLGNGSNTTRSVPTVVDSSGALSGRRVISVAAGSSHSLALCSDGGLVSWGDNSRGQLGIESVTISSVPVAVNTAGALSGKSVVSISSSYDHNLALCSDGTVVAWGNNNYGQLGNTTTTTSSLPVLVDATGVLAGKTVVSVSAGSSHSIAVCSDGTVAAWGYNGSGRLGNNSTTNSSVPVMVDATGVLAGKTVVAVSAGGSHSIALCSNGTVASWGGNNYGQLGNNSTTNSSTPVAVVVNGVLAGKTVVALSAGNDHNIALCADGTVATWGFGTAGQLGTGNSADYKTPVLVGMSGVPFGKTTSIKAGAFGCMVVSAQPLGTRLSGLSLSEGKLWPDFSSETTSYSVGVSAGTSTVSVFPTAEDASVVSVNGNVVPPAGSSDGIPILDGPTTIAVTVSRGGVTTTYTISVVTTTMVHVDFASAGDIPISDDSIVRPGSSVDVSLGFAPPVGTSLTLVKKSGFGFIPGRFDNLAQGQLVELSFGGNIYRFVANYYGGTGNDLVLMWQRQGMYSWGPNGVGQLGDSTALSRRTPVAVTRTGVLFGKTPVAVAGGLLVGFGLCADGTLASWGNGQSGELGLGTMISSTSPMDVTGQGALAGKTVVAVSSANTTVAALCSDGKLATWGSNNRGNLGNGGTLNAFTPVAVSTTGALSGKTVAFISVGGTHCLALCSDGTLVAWGRNSEGQLGINSTADRDVPVVVPMAGALSGKTVVAVTTGYSHSLALCSDGTVATWGYNSYGQLGNASNTTSLLPVAVTTTGALAGKTVVALSHGAEFNCLVLCSDGSMAAWGRGNYGQLGNGSSPEYSNVPVAVTTTGVLSGKSVVAVTSGGWHNIVVCSDGTVATWGYNGSGSLGKIGIFESNVPVAVTSTGELYGKVALTAAAGLQSLVVAAEPVAGYLAWMSNRVGLSDKTELADPDRDGVQNLTEYVLNSNPAVSSTLVLPTVSADGADFIFNFHRLAASGEDTTQFLQYSTDMIEWSDLRISIPSDTGVAIGATDGNGNQSVIVTVPKGERGQMFGRLRVSKP